MTNPNLSHITLLCDRTGSMFMIRDDAQGAVNRFLEDQKAVPHPATLLLIDFDAPHRTITMEEPWFRVVHDGWLADAPTYLLNPRGNTALYDAMGQAIVLTGERLAAMPEAERPGHVFFVVQTDGQENSSTDWRLPKLVDLIKEHETAYAWDFIFLGMGPDAWNQAAAFVGTQMVANNTVASAGTGPAIETSYLVTSANIADTRSGGTVTSYGAHVDDDGTATE